MHDHRPAARIQAQPPVDSRIQEGPDPPRHATDVKRPPQVWLTPRQILYAGAPCLVLLLLVGLLCVVNYDYVQLLWVHPIGIKMMIMGGGCYLTGVCLYLSG